VHLLVQKSFRGYTPNLKAKESIWE
jgi:hypothetical protein